MENGKTLAESRAELRRAIENVEVACGIPTLMQGYNLEDVASGIDEMMIRQPLGVVAAIAPFNFPVMIPFWFLPYAIACGNTFILKPSESVPLTSQRVFELMEQTGLPPGVVNLVHGGKAAVDALLDHPECAPSASSGSTPVAKYIYAQGAAHGKRVQCQGGAKNHVVVLPTPTWTWPRRSSATARLAARASAAWLFRWRLRGRGAAEIPANRSRMRPRRSRSATDWTTACRWAR